MTTTPSRPRALLIGATGPTGLAIIDQAAARGLALKALARRPEVLAGKVETVKGDVLDKASLAEAMKGCDLVISSLGVPLTMRPVSLLSEGTRNLLAAMEKAGVSRLLCITGVGAGDSKGHGNLLYDWVLLPLVLNSIYADKNRQEELVKASSTDHVLVRPAFLTNGPLSGKYRVLTDLAGQRLTVISRRDVAHFIVGEALNPAHHRVAVNLSD